jgi:hypothetical protein
MPRKTNIIKLGNRDEIRGNIKGIDVLLVVFKPTTWPRGIKPGVI